jgi:hypothetical protein
VNHLNLGVFCSVDTVKISCHVVKEKTIAGTMAALSGMYEKPSANNKVHLMEKLFNLKMEEDTSVAHHLTKLNMITNKLSSIEIDFDDEIRVLIVLAYLPNSWEAMKIAVSNSTRKSKLKYKDIRDLILSEKVHRKDSGEASSSCSALNLETRAKGKQSPSKS